MAYKKLLCQEFIGHFQKLLMRLFLNRFLLMEMLFETIQLLGVDVEDSRLLYHNGQIFDARRVKLDASRMSDGPDDVYIRYDLFNSF